MELRIAAKSGVERCVEQCSLLATPVPFKETVKPLTIAEVDHRKTSLLLEEATKTCRTEPSSVGDFGKRDGLGGVADDPSGALNGRMNIPDRHLVGIGEASPRFEQRISETYVHESRLFCGGGQLGEEMMKPGKAGASKTAAGVAP